MERAAHYPWAANTIRSNSQQILPAHRSRAADPASQGTRSHQRQFLPSFVKIRGQKATSLCSTPKPALTILSLDIDPEQGCSPPGRGGMVSPGEALLLSTKLGKGWKFFCEFFPVGTENEEPMAISGSRVLFGGEVAGPGCGCESGCPRSNAGAFTLLGGAFLQLNFWVLQTA